MAKDGEVIPAGETVQQDTPSELSLDERLAEVKKHAADATGLSFLELLRTRMESADVLLTREVRDKDTMQSVPFWITKCSFNPGIGGDFVSLEVSPADGEPCVVNDGSTGVRRQIVDLLVRKGIVDPGEAHVDAETGEKFNALDNPVSLWRKGQDTAHEGWELNYLIPRGLRYSDYTFTVNGVTGEARTYYLS